MSKFILIQVICLCSVLLLCANLAQGQNEQIVFKLDDFEAYTIDHKGENLYLLLGDTLIKKINTQNKTSTPILLNPKITADQVSFIRGQNGFGIIEHFLDSLLLTFFDWDGEKLFRRSLHFPDYYPKASPNFENLAIRQGNVIAVDCRRNACYYFDNDTLQDFENDVSIDPTNGEVFKLDELEFISRPTYKSIKGDFTIDWCLYANQLFFEEGDAIYVINLATGRKMLSEHEHAYPKKFKGGEVFYKDGKLYLNKIR